MEKIIGNYKVFMETILDPEGEVIYHKVISPMFKGKVLELMYEDDLTEDVIKNHIKATYNEYQLDEWYPDSHI
jgi:hypothetical protein